jgi:hypothetical protein
MRLVIDVPDDSEEATLLQSVPDPRAYIFHLLRSDSRKSESRKGVDVEAILARAARSPNRFKTREEVDAYINALRDEW